MMDSGILGRETGSRGFAFTLSPQLILCLMMLIFAVLEFYPTNYRLSSAWFFGMSFVGLSWLFIFPKTVVLGKANFEALFFLVFWLIYSLIGYLWAVDKSAVLEYSYLIFRYLITFMIFEIFLRNNPAILAKGHYFLMFTVGVYFLTALWEIITFSHLPSSRLYQNPMPIPTGPFYNENNLAAFLLMLFPVMLFFARLVPNIWGKIISVSSTVLFLAVITIQGARIAMLVSAATLGVFFIFFMKRRYRLLSLVGIALALLMFVQLFPVQAKIGAGLLEHELGSLRSETETVKMSSVKIRKHLIGEVLELTAESKFMGLGGGNIERHMSTDRTHRTAGIINAHNWMLELMGNFGIIPLFIFVYIYLKWLHLLWQKYRESEGRLKTLYMSYILVLILFIPASVLPSSICWYNNYWIVFAAINALCHTPSSQIKEHV